LEPTLSLADFTQVLGDERMFVSPESDDSLGQSFVAFLSRQV